MNIVIVVDCMDSLTNGTVMTTKRFVSGLRNLGHQVRLVAFGVEGEEDFNLKEKYLPVVSEVCNLHQIKLGKYDEHMLMQAYKGADIVHLLMPFELEKKCKKLADKMGIPTTAAFHVQPENITYNIKLSWFEPANKFIYKFFLNSFYRNFNHIHCPSNFIAEQLRKNKYNAKLHIISNGVSNEFEPPKELKILDKGKINILMIGRLDKEKNQQVIIKAISLSKYKEQIHLTLLGKGTQKKQLIKLQEKLDINPIEFNFLSTEELVKKIHTMDLYIHSSIVEIEAIACIEAISCGLVPIIASSKKSASRQFALEEQNLFINNNPQDLARKIDYWIDNEERKYQMSNHYINYAKQYKIEHSLLLAERMFQEAIGELV